MATPERNGQGLGRMDELLDRTLADLTARQRFPESTYRLQFHAGFTFRDAERIVPYLYELGVTDCYASPYLKASPGTKHGYDISDHRTLNPEIGTDEDYAAFTGALEAHGLGHLLDVVPNHMGIAGNENVWWNDVLENGRCSPAASYFDIDWDPIKPALRDKVLLPVLGDPYGKVLESGQLQLRYADGAFTIHYYDRRFPVSPSSYGLVLDQRVEELEAQLGKESSDFLEYQSIRTAVAHLPPLSSIDPVQVAERRREKEVIKRRLAVLTAGCAPVREFLEQNVVRFNGQPGNPHSFDLLDQLLNQQAYRLSYWRVASDEINYRRFFDINDLAALSMEKPEVFAAAHELIFRFLREHKVTGLRIDHPDGLYDPHQYLERLQEHYVLECARQQLPQAGQADSEWSTLEGPLLERIRERRRLGDLALERPLYVVVEKILGRGEPIPEDWPVHGTTGYEFLNLLNGLFVDPVNASLFHRIYQRWTKVDCAFLDVAHAKKFLILQVSLSGELHMLAHQLDRLSENNRWSRDFTLNSLRHALREIIACFPVYRSYIGDGRLSLRDIVHVEAAVTRAKQKNAAISASLFDFVRDMLLLRYPDGTSEADQAEQRRFVGKFQQVTAPVTAKGIEDTAFYVYNCLVSLNEVGGDPNQFGVLPAVFHRSSQERQSHWPWALSATSTHDTKRSEDVRARVNVLSEMPQDWQQCLSRWNGLNKRHRVDLDGAPAPDRNDEYLLYQTLIGAWPLECANAAAPAEFVQRIQAYMQKALHEAKVHTSWINPNPAYDGAVERFVARVLDEEENKRFLQDFRSFQRRVSHFGLLNSLAQTVLKVAAPGAADVYQGTELWDFSLVDPDNRRPVDYARRAELLHDLKKQSATAGPELPGWARELAEAKEDGRIKLYVLERMLHARREHPGLFGDGAYVPVTTVGARSEHLCAFVRHAQSQRALVVVPRLVVGLTGHKEVLPVGPEIWQDTRLVLAEGGIHQRWRNLFTNESLTPGERDGQPALPAAEVFAHFPVAVLLAQD